MRSGNGAVAGAPAYDVFLSHSSEDDELAQRVRMLLEVAGIRAFATPGSIPSGLWNPQIERALQRSQHLWLLLTPSAVNKSIWAHQEFGYFCGYKRALDPESADQRLHYFEVEGNKQRPGMYAHFQATPVSSFEDPVALARIIAQSLRKPESTEGGRLVSILKWPEGAPLNLG